MTSSPGASSIPIITYRPDRERWIRPVKVLAVQNGPATTDKRKNVAQLVEWMKIGLDGFHADFVAFCELATTMYFGGSGDYRWQDQAESIPGPTTDVFSALAAEHNVNIILPLFERGPRSGEFYNSAVFLDRRGEIIPGVLPDGTQLSCYRKTHIPNSRYGRPVTNEKYFFRPGPGLPVFKTDVGTVGCLICYDRSFPEAWRVLSLSGAEIVFVPLVSPMKRRAQTFLLELQAAAVQNGVFVVAINKGGLEVVEDERVCFGASCLIHPDSDVLARCPMDEGPALMRVELDLADRADYDHKYHFIRDRRPELYGILSQVSFV